LLRAQLDFLRKRAERRLGARFGELLGKCHSYRELSAEILADYVSAGDYKDAGTASRPHYSDITRSADLFFSEGPFAFPVTLVDTPGNNDPFLVRDEITRRALDNPDIFVFVLSALQPLSAADIAMLRLLNGLHKDRIIVFINRVDQLPDPQADGGAIKGAVQRRLRAEFPAIDIPVIIGSSRWGNLGLLAEHVDLRSHLSAAHVRFLLESEPGRASGSAAAGTLQERLSQALYASSGLPQVAAAMTRSMASSGPALVIRQVAAIFLEIARSTELLARAELQSIEDHLAARQLEATTLTEKLAGDQEALRLLEERVGALRDTFRHIETHFGELIASGSETLRRDLQRLVHDFADHQAQTVLAAHATRGARPPRACNVMPLRVRLETAYLQTFGQLAGDLMRIESFLYPQLKAIVANLSSDTPSGYLEPPAEPMQPLPSAPLSVTVALDLGERWWKMWLAGRPTAQEQADHLRRLIDAEFAGIVEELVRLAQMRLTERSEHTLRRLNAVSDGLLSGVEKRRSLLAAEYDRLHKLGEDTIRQSDGGRAQRTCAAALSACTAVGEELAGLIAALEAATGETQPEGPLPASAGT
ncbi:MAG TPA: hypothetical protein VJ740_03130, partial [Hyphomicrobiaceae bacterium]|nr:hypothetical protein [Hyphomicrobiaceae bacterium]